MSSTVDDDLDLKTKCFGNFRKSNSYGADDLAKTISKIVRERSGCRTLDFLYPTLHL